MKSGMASGETWTAVLAETDGSGRGSVVLSGVTLGDDRVMG
jgi:hypothetical protein